MFISPLSVRPLTLLLPSELFLLLQVLPGLNSFSIRCRPVRGPTIWFMPTWIVFLIGLCLTPLADISSWTMCDCTEWVIKLLSII